MSLGAVCCGYFCYETIHEFLTYPTKTVISNIEGIKFPDITICNYNGFDMTVLKNLIDIINEENFNYSLSNNRRYASETFEKAILRIYEKYKIYFAKYVENDNFNRSIRKDIMSLKELFGKKKLQRFLHPTEIVAGGISDWQLLLWCKYGKSFLNSQLIFMETGTILNWQSHFPLETVYKTIMTFNGCMSDF